MKKSISVLTGASGGFSIFMVSGASQMSRRLHLAHAAQMTQHSKIPLNFDVFQPKFYANF